MNRFLSLTLALLISLTWVATVSSFSTPAFTNATTRKMIVNKIYMSESAEDNTEASITEDFTPPAPVKCPNCDKCDGTGRILGGIPLILPWWPIKPYRPCPNFIANGGQYSRIGQPLDEIAFGRGGPINDEDDDF
mmetsp:Transcript_26040/g.38531  ORF Transcript_26040/g.38531 Transcript_26040/m.38531 type:complete len:135 (+) Transcript_26040:74-478(+)